MSKRSWIVLLAHCLGVSAWGGPVTLAQAPVVVPTDTELRSHRERMGSALDAVEAPKGTGRPVVPDPTKLPQPATTGPDIARIAETYRQTTPGSVPGKDVPELMVFISFSLPKETLERIITQAEKSGAVLVLRGLKGNSLTRMGEEIAELVGARNVTAIIHPPAFKQFKVRQVPALVLARSGQASQIGEDGCAPASSFIRVDGDVTQDYALDLIERQAPAWADVARRYASRLSGSAMSKRHWLLIALLLASRAWAQGDAASSAFAEGKALGAGTIDSAFQGIGNGTGAATVPGFGQSTPQSQVFQAGQGQLSGSGTAKIIDCASQAPDVDSYRRQECDAVNFVARNPAVRPAFSIDRANDPLISRARALARNPTMSGTGITAGNPAEQCRVVTETLPASFSRETCNDYRPVNSSFCSTARQIRVDQHQRYQCVEQMQSVSNASCFIGQQIAVDTRYRYQCDQTVQGYESLSCRRGVSVTVGFGQCTPGVWLGRTAFIDCGDCVDPYMAMNIFCGSDGRSYAVEPYRSGDGENRFDYRTLGYEWDGSYGRFPVAVAPGQSISDHYVSDLGYGCHLYVYFSVSCSATTCTPSVRNVSAGCNSAGGSGTGAALQLPMSTTVSSWRSSECASLQQRAQ